MPPLISICMPHLNSQPFTRERLATIQRQTLKDWELIVADSASNDGSREMIEACAREDQRVQVFQAPRDGIYTNLNRCLERCSGEFVYIATSDDTMADDCLERLVAALQRNPGCGLAHCGLQIIDKAGHPVSAPDSWDHYVTQAFYGDWLARPHVRRAPHDGLLHFGYFTVYTSLTQLLVRRSVYQRLGLFRTDCASYADFEWGMRVSLQVSVVHVPAKLATWRRHGAQATSGEKLLRARAAGGFHRLACCALSALEQEQPSLASALRRGPLLRHYLVDEMKARRLLARTTWGKAAQAAGFFLRHPVFGLDWMTCKLRRRRVVGPFDDAVRRELAKFGCDALLPAA